jgi:hypothetical protein
MYGWFHRSIMGRSQAFNISPDLPIGDQCSFPNFDWADFFIGDQPVQAGAAYPEYRSLRQFRLTGTFTLSYQMERS